MKIDFSQTLKDLNGNNVILQADEKGNPLLIATLGNVVNTALMAPNRKHHEQGPMPGMEALKVFSLALRIHEAKEPIDVTAEEVVLMKEKVAEFYNLPFIVGHAWNMLDS